MLSTIYGGVTAFMVDLSIPTVLKEAIKKLPLDIPGPMLGEIRPLDPNFKQDNDLQNSLESVLKSLLPSAFDTTDTNGPALNCKYGFAVVDLTDDPSSTTYNRTQPAYAGWNDTRHLFIASMAKLLILYGAFQLRRDLQGLADLGIDDLAELATNVRQRYRGMNAATSTQPTIESFFTLQAGKVDFTAEPMDDSVLNGVHVDISNSTGLKARELLRRMVGWSDNNAAALVMRALSFEYLWALTQRSGLYRNSWDEALGHNNPRVPKNGGLFIYKEFQTLNRWRNPPIEAPIGGPSNPSQAGNARSVATLMTKIAQESLIDREAHAGMLEMLRKIGEDFWWKDILPDGTVLERGEYSPIGNGMYNAYPDNADKWKALQVQWSFSPPVPVPNPRELLAASKIGIHTKCFCNILLVRNERRLTTGGTVPVTAVLVGIDWQNGDENLIKNFGAKMAKELDKRHGVYTSI
jgi:hypothetical protein